MRATLWVLWQRFTCLLTGHYRQPRIMESYGWLCLRCGAREKH